MCSAACHASVATANQQVDATGRGSNAPTPQPATRNQCNECSSHDAPQSNLSATNLPDRAQSFGTEGVKIVLGAVDPQARWVYFCQPSPERTRTHRAAGFSPKAWRLETDDMRAYLQVAGTLRDLTALLAFSPDGRYLAVLDHEQQPQLIDAQSGQMTSLANLQIDLRFDVQVRTHRSIAFSNDSTKAAFLVRDQPPRIVVRQLSGGTEHHVTPVAEHVWRIEFDAADQNIVLHEVLEDTNQNGRIEWPFLERTAGNTVCRSAVGAIDVWAPTGDSATVTIAPIDGGQALPVEGFLTSLGPNLIVRRDPQGLVAIEGSKMRPMAASDCDLRVLGISTHYGRILGACSDRLGHHSLEFDSPTERRQYPFEVVYPALDWLVPETNRFTAVYAGVHTYLADYKTGVVSQLQERDQLLAQGAAGMLVRRGTSVVLVDSNTGVVVTLVQNVTSGARIVTGPGYVVAGTTLLSAASGRAVGTIAQYALAVAANGCVLVTRTLPSDDAAFLRGPLQWLCLDKP